MDYNHLQRPGGSLEHDKMFHETKTPIAVHSPSTEEPIVTYPWTISLTMDTPAPQVRRVVRGSSELHPPAPRTLRCVHLLLLMTFEREN